MNLNYLHREIPQLSGGFLNEGKVKVKSNSEFDYSNALDVCLGAMELARKLGIKLPSHSSPNAIPYNKSDDTLLYKAPLTTALTNKKMLFLRGWKQFESCVKGFNTLGLMAYQVQKVSNKIDNYSDKKLRALKLQFLSTRKDLRGKNIFVSNDLECISDNVLSAIDNFDLAFWLAFCERTIYCSTSSNMGISTHQALRLMQQIELVFLDKKFTLLNSDEGSLVVWAPDERADFMNEEKSSFLRNLEKEKPQITKIRTYVNRQERDPGALADALLNGGYFFPTNPQSQGEMQNLVFTALQMIESVNGISREKLFHSKKTVQTLESIDAQCNNNEITIMHGVEGGIFGLMIPYFAFLEEALAHHLPSSISAWNQASIGAAFAAAALADDILRKPLLINDDVRGRLNSYFPEISKFMDTKSFGKDIKSRIHGVFDLANLQSLAQLLGVVVENHLSGRGTAYVGLGSSSYSNGNRCFEILKKSMVTGGAFVGKDAFHASTHAINPYAQGIIFGEDLIRFLNQFKDDKKLSDQILNDVSCYVKKPEPAGAASLAGYLLTRLDTGTLSILEIAYALKLIGFDKRLFLEFIGFSSGENDLSTFLQYAYEEGTYMGNLSKNMMILFDWDLDDLMEEMIKEKNESIIKYYQSPLDDIHFEQLDGSTALYLTGDNCRQPQEEIIQELAKRCYQNKPFIDDFIDRFSKFKFE